MAGSDLQERLRNHAQAFDGLLSLIPSTMYYPEASKTRWDAKKQDEDQPSSTRRDKLDPDNDRNRNAKEIMEQRSQCKRNAHHADAQDQQDADGAGDGAAAPGKTRRLHKKAPISSNQKKALAREKRNQTTADGEPNEKAINKPNTDADQTKQSAPDVLMGNDGSEAALTTEDKHEHAASIDPVQPRVPESENSTPSTLSISTLATPSSGDDADRNHADAATAAHRPKHIVIPANTEALRARLAAKIEALRAARKADGTNGKPVRTRQELIEARREKRKAQKQELRRKAQTTEELKREELLTASSPVVASPSLESGDQDACFAFGRVAFKDGSQLSHGLDYVLNREGAKKKGPSDPKTALLKLRGQQERLQNMEDDKRQGAEQKEAWLTARRRAEGEKIRDESTLKRAVKRKQQAKKKSSREWEDRIKGVEQSIKMRQRKREDNLQKRKDGKGSKKGGGSKGGKGRPGFEGSSGFGGKKKK